MKSDRPTRLTTRKPAGPEDLLSLQVAALEAAANPILISRVDGTIIWVNEAFEQLSGYTRIEAVGQKTSLLKSGEQSSSFYKNMWEMILSGQKWQGELCNRRKNGRFYPEEMTITPVKNEWGKITHFIAIKLDITERKRLDERLCLLARAVENSSELIAITDSNGLVIVVNKALLQVTGYQESEVLGKHFAATVISPNNPPTFSEELLARSLANAGWRGECLSRRRDGTDFPTFLNTGRINDGQGQLIGLYGISHDITDRKRMEAEIRASDSYHRAIFGCAFDSITVADEQGRFEYVNPAACRMFGYTSSELLAMDIPAILEAGEIPRLTRLLKHLVPGEVSYQEWRSRRKDGSVFSAEVGVSLMPNGRLLGIGRDITDRKLAEEALQEGRTKLDAALASMTDAVFISDATGRFVEINEAFATFHRFKNRVECAKKFDDYPDFLEVFTADGKLVPVKMWAVPRALRGETATNAEYQLHRKDTGESWVGSYSFSPIRDNGGAIVGSVVVARDITDLKRAELELRTSKERLDLAVEVADIGEWELDLINHTARRSPRHDQIFGYQSLLHEWTYEMFLDHVLPRDRAVVDEKFKASLASGFWDFEARIRRTDGEVRWIWARGRRWTDENGQPTRMLGTVVDITERKQAELARWQSEERLRLAQLAAGMGIFDIDLESRKAAWSPQMLEIFGLPVDSPQPSYEDAVRFAHPDDRSLVEQQSARLFAGQAIHFDHRIVRPGGEVRWVEISGSAIFDDAGRPVRFPGLCRDVTERKLLESQFRHAQKMEAVGSLAAGVAHDFNNLLGVILGNTELLSERIPSDEISQKYLASVRMAVNSATSVTRQLLAFSRKQILQSAILDLNVSVLQLNKMTQRLIGENIRMVLSLEKDLGYVKADPGQIEQMLMNLVVNARDAMLGGGTLTIETSNVSLDQEFVKRHFGSMPGDFIKLSVKDTGFGMKKDVLAHIFEPFFTTKEQGKGTGLGLATVYGIVKQSEGYIWVESEPAVGTIFDIYLPRVERKPVVEKPRESAGFAWGSETILLVEDEQPLREVTRVQLEKLGYCVYEAENAEKAINLFDVHAAEISLLLTDVIMPGINGRVLADKLREKQPKLRILFMSGYTDDEILRQGGSDSGLPILTKPFSSERLSSRIRGILDGKPRPPKLR